ncbi:MAG: hypothetical protein EBQ80_01990 [Proteobacteria bacterium]|nr:hypothetical protein [Pseudomonadota bacterium]
MNFIQSMLSSEQVSQLKEQLLNNGIEAAKEFAMKNGISPEMAEQVEGLVKTAVTDANDAENNA